MKNIRSSYKNYIEKSENPIPIKEYCKVVNDFNKFIMATVFSGEEILLPSRLGSLAIKGRKSKVTVTESGRLKGLTPDFKATNDLWEKCSECKERKQIVYHLNEHTNGIRYRFFWSRNRVLVTNKTFYSMIFTRTNKRFITELVVKRGKEYYIETNRY